CRPAPGSARPGPCPRRSGGCGRPGSSARRGSRCGRVKLSEGIAPSARLQNRTCGVSRIRLLRCLVIGIQTSMRGSVDPLPESEQVLLQGEPGQAVPAIIYWHGMDSIGRPYHPNNRAHVSVSPGFPRDVGFLGHPTSRGIRWTPAPRRRATERLLRSLPPFDVGRRDLLSAGLLVVRTVAKGRFPTRFTMPFWAKPITRVGLLTITAVQRVRVPSRIRLR